MKSTFVGMLIFTCALAGLSANFGRAQETQASGSSNQLLLSSFASGQAFYIQKDSFKPIGNGKLQYQVTGDLGDGSQRISVNEIDCNTGQYQSPVQSWQQDSQGQISDVLPGPTGPMTVRNNTKLYGYLKDACQQFSPDTPANW